MSPSVCAGAPRMLACSSMQFCPTYSAIKPQPQSRYRAVPSPHDIPPAAPSQSPLPTALHPVTTDLLFSMSTVCHVENVVYTGPHSISLSKIGFFHLEYSPGDPSKLAVSLVAFLFCCLNFLTTAIITLTTMTYVTTS